jgi:hypothetical protein
MVVGPPESWHLSSRVHQATGMIAAQIHCGTSEALDRLKIRSAAQGKTLDDLALDVLNGVIRFDE